LICIITVAAYKRCGHFIFRWTEIP